MKPFSRADRVSGQIQKNLSDLLRKNINDPRLEMVTITGVKMSKDLKFAYIYFSVSGADSDKIEMSQKAEKGFKSALGFIKRTLAGQLGLRYMPDLRFQYDQSFDYGDKIDFVLKNIKNGTDSRSS
ncbi:MAG: 30S ribosome-binding factor RbfA [Desulfobacteraceae bacterium]|nr:MAG: 30S ribosome-binding factor RbfA [Desulfobacteraceae bacterium]